MNCNLCPNNCNVVREKTVGFCGVNDKVKIAKHYLHQYEEPFISGKNGSGTVFFCGCSLKCVFCQNYELSRNLTGKEVSVKELSSIFKELEEKGAHNINLVTPTQFSDKIIEALNIYKPKIPIIYNTHGYEKEDVIKKLNNYVDIYLPDIKFFSPSVSKRYTGKENYFEVASKALTVMTEKPIVIGNDNLIKSGTVARHLVLPMNTNDTVKILDWWKDSGLYDKAYLNLMSQYTPFGEIEKYPELNRKITKREYDKVIDYAISLGIEKLFYQSKQSADTSYIPKWDY